MRGVAAVPGHGEGLGALTRLAPRLRLTGAMPVLQGHSGIRRIDALRVAA